MAKQRKGISPKTRFEVFKRDSFTCQYCGSKAPDVLLEVDHMNPVAKGGDNNIINLITSCKNCNSGKSDRTISDQSILERQRAQLAELEERRAQLEMMMQWQHGLLDERDRQLEMFIDYFNKANDSEITLTDTGEKSVKALIKKYGYQNVINAVDTSAVKYSYLTHEDRLNKLSGILQYESASEEEKKIMYLNGILRNRFPRQFERHYCTQQIRQIIGFYKYEFLLDIFKTERNWYDWQDRMEYLIREAENSEPF